MGEDMRIPVGMMNWMPNKLSLTGSRYEVIHCWWRTGCGIYKYDRLKPEKYRPGKKQWRN